MVPYLLTNHRGKKCTQEDSGAFKGIREFDRALKTKGDSPSTPPHPNSGSSFCSVAGGGQEADFTLAAKISTCQFPASSSTGDKIPARKALTWREFRQDLQGLSADSTGCCGWLRLWRAWTRAYKSSMLKQCANEVPSV